MISALFVPEAYCQELNCKVEINTDQLEGASRQTVEALQTAVYDYMNTTSFTDASYRPEERIDCRLFFAVKSCDGENISTDLQIQSSRPVYDSSYTTQMINHKENDLKFVFRQGSEFVLTETAVHSQLNAVLDFYAYLIIAIDSDSFSKRGGDEHLSRADKIVQMGQSLGENGWRQYESSASRGAILAAWMNPATAPLRDLNYRYHRNGLDVMSGDMEHGLCAITDDLKEILPEVYETSPMSVGLTMWRDAKLEEAVRICAHESVSDRKKIAEMLKDIFPADIEMINRIENRQ
ncbi:MAG: DUF4835 family protein [Bacteroidales bacterium]|nr:DUF4835 family protein [Bacteroidales bacterium]